MRVLGLKRDFNVGARVPKYGRFSTPQELETRQKSRRTRILLVSVSLNSELRIYGGHNRV